MSREKHYWLNHKKASGENVSTAKSAHWMLSMGHHSRNEWESNSTIFNTMHNMLMTDANFFFNTVLTADQDQDRPILVSLSIRSRILTGLQGHGFEAEVT